MQSWFDVPTTQMSIFVIFVSAGILFDGVFSLWVSLIYPMIHTNLTENLTIIYCRLIRPPNTHPKFLTSYQQKKKYLISLHKKLEIVSYPHPKVTKRVLTRIGCQCHLNQQPFDSNMKRWLQSSIWIINRTKKIFWW